MKASVKKTMKFALGVCAALSLVAVGAVAASGAAVKVVAEGVKAGAETMKKTMDELRAEAKAEACAAEGSAATEFEDITEEVPSEAN